ncbi:methylphosphonate hydroxylase-like [Amphiura filiformis]|uniref:methylphosphonate hydroxylase-like n=1 Tax=Amphiura filiformis TaxID=82378 RepID=UPI003B2264B6
MSASPKAKRQKTGEGAVSTWPKFTERLDQSKTKDVFKEEGYMKAVKYLSEAEITAVKDELKRYQDEVVPKDVSEKHKFYEEKDNKDSIIRLERLMDYDTFFKDLSESPAFNGLADMLLDMPCEPNNVQFFSKPPGGKCTPPHQDGRYFMHEKGITFWLALDDADEENGCMYYVPKLFKEGELPHERTSALGFSQGLIDYTEEMKKTELKMDVPKGTLLGHHAYTIHRAGNNKSDTRWRPAIGLTYWAKSCRDDKELHQRREEYHKKLYADLKDTGRI